MPSLSSAYSPWDDPSTTSWGHSSCPEANFMWRNLWPHAIGKHQLTTLYLGCIPTSLSQAIRWLQPQLIPDCNIIKARTNHLSQSPVPYTHKLWKKNFFPQSHEVSGNLLHSKIKLIQMVCMYVRCVWVCAMCVCMCGCKCI